MKNMGVKWMRDELARLNSDGKFEVDIKDNITIFGTVIVYNLKLPKGYYWDSYHIITNKGYTEQGIYEDFYYLCDQDHFASKPKKSLFSRIFAR